MRLAWAQPSVQLDCKSVFDVLVTVQRAKAECDRTDGESLNSFRQQLCQYVLVEDTILQFFYRDAVISIYGFGNPSDVLDSKLT